MSRFTSHIHTPVKREGAVHYLRLTLLSFAASVILTRWFLQATGYPSVGDSRLHIAHVLWGGLLLFIASILPLILANRNIYNIGALLGGVGVGLFIDEVGKFLTRTNDYFFQPAAPIIYAFFLIVVLLYLEIRRPPAHDPRAELYRALDAFQEVLDHDLDEYEHERLAQRLRRVAQQNSDPELAQLATALLNFLQSGACRVIPDIPTFTDRLRQWGQGLEARYVTQERVRLVLLVGLGIFGLQGLLDMATLAVVRMPPAGMGLISSDIIGFLSRFIPANNIPTRLALEGLSDLPILASAVLLLVGDDRRGVAVGRVALLLSLTIFNLLVFYVDQFSAISDTLIQFGLFMTALYYRQHYLRIPPRPRSVHEYAT